jgi:hypothetical protein
MENGPLNALKQELSDAVASIDFESFVRGIDQGDHYLSSISSIDGAGSVQNRDPMLGCKS